MEFIEGYTVGDYSIFKETGIKLEDTCEIPLDSSRAVLHCARCNVHLHLTPFFGHDLSCNCLNRDEQELTLRPGAFLDPHVLEVFAERHHCTAAEASETIKAMLKTIGAPNPYVREPAKD